MLSQGFVRKSWLEIAEALKLPVTVQSREKIECARASSGVDYHNSSGFKKEDDDGVIYTLSNSLPYIAVGGGAWIAEASLAARGKAWDIAPEKGLVHDTEYLRLPRLVVGIALRPLTLRDYLRLSAEN